MGLGSPSGWVGGIRGWIWGVGSRIGIGTGGRAGVGIGFGKGEGGAPSNGCSWSVTSSRQRGSPKYYICPYPKLRYND